MTRIGRNGIILSLRSAMPAAAIVISGGCASAPTLQPYTEIVPGSVRDLDMLAIPGGTITIKDPENAGRTRAVEVGPFWIATYEITWDQYDPFVFEDMEPDRETERDANAFRRHKIGIVFQQYNLIATLTAQQNIELPGMLAGDSPKELSERSGELLERLGLSDRADHRPDALSGGEQHRVAIARALRYTPPILLADEPTGNLDSASSDALWSLLGEIAKEHEMTVLMITHEPAAAAHCQRVFLLADGRIQGQIDTEGLDAAGVASRYHELVRSA